jgi:hypothetical protein
MEGLVAMRFPRINREHIPRSRLARSIVGLLLLIGGILGFLPVVGFWMIPLGLIVLSVDFPFVRRFRRRLAVRWGRALNRKKYGEPHD